MTRARREPLPRDAGAERPAVRDARGHAFYASEARRALGIAPTHVLPRLPDVPAPIFEGAVTLAASAVCVLVRPQAVGLRTAVLLDVVLVLLTCAAVLHHSRLVVPEGVRPGLEVIALPAAALLSLAVTVAGSGSVPVGLGAALLAGVVATVVPTLDARRLAGHDGTRIRVVLDIAGIAVMVPLALLAAADSVAAPARVLLVGVGAGAVAYDALRVPRATGAIALAATAVIALALGAVAAVAPHVQSGDGPAGGLLLWYGLRGAAASLLRRPRAPVAVVEYTVFVAAAITLLVVRR